MDVRKTSAENEEQAGESLCGTCSHARIIQGRTESERIVICERAWETLRVSFVVVRCTGYTDRRLPDLDEMKEIAWVLRTKSAGHRAGFVSAEKNRELEVEEEEESEAARS